MAQLTLSGPPTPEPGQGLAALALASRLDREAERLIDRSADAAALDRLRMQARASVRRGAGALAQLGETLGADGSAAVLWALTLDGRMTELDALLEGVDDAGLLVALEADFAALAIRAERGAAIPAESLDAMIGDALSAIALEDGASAAARAGWLRARPWPDAPGDELRIRLAGMRDLELPAETAGRIEQLADQLDEGATWPTYARRARARSAAIAAAMDAVLALPAWTPEPVGARLVSDLASALDGPDAAGLALIAETGRVLVALDRMEEGRESQRLRARAAEAISERESNADLALAAARLAADVLETSVSRPGVQLDSGLTRVVRPAWRALVPRVRGVTVNARDEAVSLLVDPSGATSPAVLSTVASQRRLFDDFDALERLSERLEAGLAGPPGLTDAVADRVLGLGQSLRAGGDDAEASIELLRTMDRQLATLGRIETDRERAARVMGDRGPQLGDRIDGLRRDWLGGWAVAGGSGPGDAVRDDLSMLSQLTGFLADVEGFTRQDAVRRWPGLELTQRGQRAITRGLTEAIDDLLPDAMRAGNEVARQRSQRKLVLLRGDYAPVLVVGRLARLGERIGLTPGSPLEELALGPPNRDAWMAEHRGALADISRYADEYGRALIEQRSDVEANAAIKAVLSWRALRLLERIEASDSAVSPSE